ncbi:unnamed protein product [Coccothraustes coccothraustes]
MEMGPGMPASAAKQLTKLRSADSEADTVPAVAVPHTVKDARGLPGEAAPPLEEGARIPGGSRSVPLTGESTTARPSSVFWDIPRRCGLQREQPEQSGQVMHPSIP